ncbi:MAG TPA: hypothetical protein VHL80_03180, partial [Polyangia bacterium]|nr:hypothetical protein [Polyangia bacterium]
SGGGAGTPGAAGTGAAGVFGAPYEVGAVDLSRADPTFSMTSCDGGIGTLTFVNPCLVGNNLTGATDPSAPGPHVVECTTTMDLGAVSWSFIVSLPPTLNPQTVFLLAPGNPTIDLPNGQQARATMVEGQLTFLVVDPGNQAFEGRFVGDVRWTESSGYPALCTLDAVIWGAPAPFN